MQLCLDGKDPSNHESDLIQTDKSGSFAEVEEIPNVIGLRGMKGIENYLKIDASKCNITPTDTAEKKDKGLDINLPEINMSTSYAETVSALLKSPPPLLVSTVNKENDNGTCNEKIGLEFEHNGLKSARKRSLTEMSGHNPLSKERKPLGQKRCFETDL